MYQFTDVEHSHTKIPAVRLGVTTPSSQLSLISCRFIAVKSDLGRFIEDRKLGSGNLKDPNRKGFPFAVYSRSKGMGRKRPFLKHPWKQKEGEKTFNFPLMIHMLLRHLSTQRNANTISR